MRVAAAVLCAAFLAVPIAGADARRSETEREVLARAVEELALIEAILVDAERRADADARIYFDYAALRKDLGAVREGVGDYVGGGRPQPRVLAPLSANYTRLATEE